MHSPDGGLQGRCNNLVAVATARALMFSYCFFYQFHYFAICILFHYTEHLKKIILLFRPFSPLDLLNSIHLFDI